MNISKLSLLLLLIGLIGLTSCERFEEFNQNPNEPTDVSAGVLLTSTIRTSVNTATNESFLLGNNVAQLTTKTLRTEVDDYNWNAFPTVWEGFYTSLTDAFQVEKNAVAEGNEPMQGAAIVMRTWIFANLTNAYGDIPYSEAIKGDSANITPVYDTQEEIYSDMLAELDRAVALLSGDGPLNGDILLGGDAAKWQRLANSLRLRLLMTANAQIPDAGDRFEAIVNEGNIMQSNEDNAVLEYLGSFPNEFPLIPLKQGDFDAVAFSQTALDVMGPVGDPRLARYARPNNDSYADTALSAASFTGATNGAGGCNKAGSRLGAQYWIDPGENLIAYDGPAMGDGLIMTYAEVEFLLAEAVAKGWITGNIEDHYRAGIAASMEYYQVDVVPFGWTSFDDFYENSGVAYEQVTDIWEQKWVALFFNGLDPYFEVRRWYVEGGGWDGIPFLDAPCNNRNNDQLPFRFLYPGEEQSLNQANYEEASSRIGGDEINTEMWLVQ
jgi:hypothetical protein